MSADGIVLALVFPCYNEQEMLPHSFVLIESFLDELKTNGSVSKESFALFVDDGSVDGTWSLISDECDKKSYVEGVKLASNSGHQNALLAGMMHVKLRVDCVITMDVDLQDDINAIKSMLHEFKEGNEIVYGIRSSRHVDSFFKRSTASLFYKIMRWLGAKTIAHHADFRLVSRVALEALEKFEEYNIFLRGIFPSMGFKTSSVAYERKERMAGETKYPLSKMISFALKGITMFSPAPLRFAGIMSVIVMLFTFIQAAVSLCAYFKGDVVPGWSSTMIVILFLGAVQLFCLAIIGEYLAKVFIEVKGRPRYIIEKTK